jgi:hypothetical protein
MEVCERCRCGCDPLAAVSAMESKQEEAGDEMVCSSPAPRPVYALISLHPWISARPHLRHEFPRTRGPGRGNAILFAGTDAEVGDVDAFSGRHAAREVEVDVHSAWEGVTSRRSRGGASEGQGCGYGFGGG